MPDRVSIFVGTIIEVTYSIVLRVGHPEIYQALEIRKYRAIFLDNESYVDNPLYGVLHFS